MTDSTAKPVPTKSVAKPAPTQPQPKQTLQPSAPVTAAADPAPQPARADVAPIATKDDTMTDFNQAADTATAKAETMFADASDRAKNTLHKGQQIAGELTEFSKGNVEALVESAKIAARGFQTMGQDAAVYARQSFDHASATVRSMASVKSPTELMKLQGDYMRNSFDAMVAHGSRSTEAALKLAGEIAQPISNRIALAADKVKAAA